MGLTWSYKSHCHKSLFTFKTLLLAPSIQNPNSQKQRNGILCSTYRCFQYILLSAKNRRKTDGDGRWQLGLSAGAINWTRDWAIWWSLVDTGDFPVEEPSFSMKHFDENTLLPSRGTLWLPRSRCVQESLLAIIMLRALHDNVKPTGFLPVF